MAENKDYPEIIYVDTSKEKTPPASITVTHENAKKQDKPKGDSKK